MAISEEVVGGGGYGDGFGGMGIVGLIAILALVGGGFGFGGNNGGTNNLTSQLESARTDILNQANFDTVDTQLGLINQNINNQGFQNVYAIKDLQTQMAADTCAIITNQDKIATAAELREVYAKLNEVERLASEARIINAITANIQPPRAIPAYAAPSPYAVLGGCGGTF